MYVYTVYIHIDNQSYKNQHVLTTRIMIIIIYITYVCVHSSCMDFVLIVVHVCIVSCWHPAASQPMLLSDHYASQPMLLSEYCASQPMLLSDYYASQPMLRNDDNYDSQAEQAYYGG